MLQDTCLRRSPGHITDAQLRETAALAASGRNVPDFIIRAIARRIEAEEQGEAAVRRPLPRNWLLDGPSAPAEQH
ncbi:hypothetical protein [Sphingosinicella sp. BN140058]|uniref:hypothetical protein n=1 Tax=Sphingosinicella sp. BN140058 TaxID=1892855 RepID=UPI0013EA3825|nr:hypothetical protein [Sphingosinicella sp. BN140058]